MIRGAIYAAATIAASFLLVVLLEYFGRFNIYVRTALFWTFIVSVIFISTQFFILPLSKIFNLGKIISHEQAAIIVGEHFSEIQDKLLNTLQLGREALTKRDNVLLQAAVSQRTQQLRPVPFSSAVDFRENRKYLKYLLPPIAVILVLLFAAPNVITKPTDRLIRHNQIIAEEAPFQIRVTNSDLTTPENSDFTVELELSGKEIPDKIYLVANEQKYLIEKLSPVNFKYTFRDVISDIPFYFTANGFGSDQYLLSVIPTPRLTGFQARITYPTYIQRAPETISNTGDFVLPAGSSVQWTFDAVNTNSLKIRFSDSTYTLTGTNAFGFSRRFLQDDQYVVTPANQYMMSPDSMNYKVSVIPDAYPSIAVEEAQDSSAVFIRYFNGEIKDDYGFSRLQFNYQIANGELKQTEIPINKGMNQGVFFFDWDARKLGLNPGEVVTYFFEIWDNDGVSGAKGTKSETRELKIPTAEEMESIAEQKNEDIKNKLEDSAKDAARLQKELEDLQKQLAEKNELNWKDQKRLEEILKQQEQLRQQVEKIQQENKQKEQIQNQFNQNSEEIRQKQEQLEKLMNEVMSPELMKMMEELKRLMNELNKEDIQDQLKKMDLSNEDLKKELDRALEQFKQLEWEKKMEQNIEKLKELSEKQEQLSKEAEKKETDPEKLKEEQERLNKEFEKLRDEIQKAEDLNKELESPNKVPSTEEQQKEISKDQQESTNELSKKKKDKAGKSQKSAAKKMKDMAAQMQMAMESNESEQQQEDMEALRALLENIITISFDQEDLMGKLRQLDIRDPQYVKLGQWQRKLKDDARMVEDSLFALSKRVAQLSSIVNREINLVNENMDLALAGIPDRKTAEVTTSQQLVMTSFNNLALLLDDALKQMQNQASCNKPGTGNCEKPGGSGKKPKPSAGELKKMQEQLTKQLEKMQKEGKNKGENKGNSGQMSQQLAEMAAKQAAIRRMMEEKGQELNEDGSGNGNELKQIAKEMEELQRDIVNNKIDENTIRRQQDIMTRLLKAENAERTREQDNERKSKEAQDAPVSDPARYEQYLRKKDQETELLKTVPPGLKPYYRDKVNSYFNNIGKE